MSSYSRKRKKRNRSFKNLKTEGTTIDNTIYFQVLHYENDNFQNDIYDFLVYIKNEVIFLTINKCQLENQSINFIQNIRSVGLCCELNLSYSILNLNHVNEILNSSEIPFKLNGRIVKKIKYVKRLC